MAYKEGNSGQQESVEKVGVIIEAFTTLDGTPCYWISDEPELIIEYQILSLEGKADKGPGPSLLDWKRAFDASKNK